MSFAAAPGHEGHDMNQDADLYWFAPRHPTSLPICRTPTPTGRRRACGSRLTCERVGGDPYMLKSPGPRPPL